MSGLHEPLSHPNPFTITNHSFAFSPGSLAPKSLFSSYPPSRASGLAAFDACLKSVSSTPQLGIDPQLLNAQTASPEPADDIFNKAFSQDGFAYPDFNQPTPTNTPYFHSVETSCAPVAPLFASSPLRHQLHRRSVSEPPEGFPHHHHHARPLFVPSGPPMTFTRAGHYLGQPKPQHPPPRMMTSLPKNKTCRSGPYGVKNRPQSARAQPQSRYDLRRERPQPVHAHSIGPTSMPQGSYVPGTPPAQQVFVTSRVCTPAPSPVRETMVASPGPIDPVLRGATLEKEVVSIPVDELRSMITEAVRKAVESVEAAKKTVAEDGAQQYTAGDAEVPDEDEIVVASVEGADGEQDRPNMEEASTGT